MLLKVKYQSTKKYIRLNLGFTYLEFINEVKRKFGLSDAAELQIFDETDTAVEEDILLELVEANPDLCLTVRDSFLGEDHSTPSSLTDTMSPSSDNDLSSQREWGAPTCRNVSSVEVMNTSTTEVSESEAAKEKVLCLRNLEVMMSWKSTSQHSTRRQLVNILASHMTEMHGRIPSRKQKEKYALGIISLFPSLKDPFSRKGYLTQDFLLLFGTETACKMFEKWDTTFKIKIIKEAKHLTQSTELCRLLYAAETLAENDDTSWDSDMACLLLLLYLLPPTAGRKRTKISPSDAVDKMVHFHKSCCSIDEHLRGRKGQQPYILAPGRTRNRIDTFYIVIDKQLIPCQATSSLGAFDELFKSHYVFNLSYEESLVQLYTFIQTTVYNIDINTTDESPRIRELWAKLLN
ncbi:uncharacterized protein LOC117554665 [Gymnodraco acuticeps]|uniref:Uncharacterized protein LOC117554665 n=1 Tax=Gymnodraco acuticeps TaxID=8218 RepID=A0A6P8WBY3_GYMAC|nr:uncharacterized protein LOC117554665 [Gymnodraco acuticeps]